MGINEYLMVGSRMKAYRKNRNYTQREMANMLNIPYSTYSNYENNYREPPIEIIGQFCDAVGIDIPDLMGITEPHSVLLDSLKPGESISVTDIQEQKILSDFRELNSEGKMEAIKRIEELTQINRYTKYAKNTRNKLITSEENTNNSGK